MGYIVICNTIIILIVIDNVAYYIELEVIKNG